MMNMSRGLAIVIGALLLILLSGWLASRSLVTHTQLALPQPPQNPAPAQSSKSEVAPDQSMRAPHEEGVAANSGTAAVAAAQPLGERLALGVEALQPAIALETARVLARCATLQQDFQLLEERMSREEAGAYKERMMRDREALMAQERNCQTLPAGIRTQGDELQLRSRLLRHAYAARVPGAAAELLGIPQQFAGIPVGELRDRTAEDARAGDIPTLTAWALLKAQAGDLESPDFKVFAFALQRAAGNPELEHEVSQAQAVYARVLEQYWAKRYPEQKQTRPLGFNMDKQGVFLYPQGFEEPRDTAYLAQARAMDAVLASTVHRMRKPS